MKTVLLLVAIVSLNACTKCFNCTRTWTTETYQDSAGVQLNYVLSTAKDVEYFNVCGNDEVNNAEYPITELVSQVIDGKTYYKRRISTCNCSTD